MTQRLYYNDSQTTTFTAQITERLQIDEKPALILDQTYFYPEGGGQPADTGTINGVEVIAITSRKEDGAILHILAEDIAGAESNTLDCQINWDRRFDHMQQHTGQHILTQAFVQIADAQTIGFHLGEDNVTIDLDKGGLTAKTLDQAEDLANQIVFANHPITATLLPSDQLEGVRMRKMPDTHATEGKVRVISIGDFDRTACGGTHVAHTGEIGMIKLVRLERYKSGTRVEFNCGWRALHDLRQKNRILLDLAADLTVSYHDLDDAISRIKDDFKQTRRSLKTAQSKLLDYQSADLIQSASIHEGTRLIKHVFDEGDLGSIRALVSDLTTEPNMIVLTGIAGAKAQLIFARSTSLDHDMAAALKVSLADLGSDRGGGRPDFAQGGGIAADSDRLASALDAAEKHLFS